jgi:erythromycin esterase
MDHVTEWLRRDDAGAGLPRDATVVGFGDVTHGTRELYELRFRWLRRLVTEAGFSTLAIEASSSAAELVNDFVLHGRGDRETVLTGLGSVMWDVEELAEVLDWLRDHNRHAAHPVGFVGLDIWNTAVARKRLAAPSTRAVLERVAASEARGMLLAREHLGEDLLDDLPRGSRQIVQWVRANLTAGIPDGAPLSLLPRTPGLNNQVRSVFMAQNLVRHLVRSRAKVVVWAHLYHLGDGRMGRYLRRYLGRRYHVFAMEAGRGRYLSRRLLPGRSLGDLYVADLPELRARSLPWYLCRTGLPELTVDLRAAPPAVDPWLATPRRYHSVSWLYDESLPGYAESAVRDLADGLIFVADTSPTTPTRGALDTVARGAAH